MVVASRREQRMSYWMIKCRENAADGRGGWHWQRYFSGDGVNARREFDFGGPDWIRSPRSQKLLHEQVKKEQFVLCYQSDTREIIGLTITASKGKKSEGSGKYDRVWLVPAVKALELNVPVSVSMIRTAGCEPQCLSQAHGTVFPVSASEFTAIVRILALHNPAQRADLQRWLATAGYARKITIPRMAGGSGDSIRAGGGFGTPEENARVEAAAVRYVARWFRGEGWRVKSVEQDCCGFDLICTKGNQRLDVEVKGCRGRGARFILTSGELTQAKSNQRFRLCLVTEAVARPQMYEWTGRQLLDDFDLRPIQYIAASCLRLE